MGRVIKATATTDTGEPLLILGVTRENVNRMIAGKPIRVTAAELVTMGLPAVGLVIHYGRTEQAIVDEYRQHGVTAPLENQPGSNVE